jgi:hypothetical protein
MPGGGGLLVRITHFISLIINLDMLNFQYRSPMLSLIAENVAAIVEKLEERFIAEAEIIVGPAPEWF